MRIEIGEVYDDEGKNSQTSLILTTSDPSTMATLKRVYDFILARNIKGEVDNPTIDLYHYANGFSTINIYLTTGSKQSVKSK